MKARFVVLVVILVLALAVPGALASGASGVGGWLSGYVNDGLAEDEPKDAPVEPMPVVPAAPIASE